MLQINPQRVLINTDTVQTSFAMTFTTDTVPTDMQLSFSTYGYSTVYHVLKPSLMYIYFTLGSTTASNPPILKVHVSSTAGPSTSTSLAGKTVLTSSANSSTIEKI